VQTFNQQLLSVHKVRTQITKKTRLLQLANQIQTLQGHKATARACLGGHIWMSPFKKYTRSEFQQGFAPVYSDGERHSRNRKGQ